MDEKSTLERLMVIEDIAEKKAGIYARLLTEPALAKAMEKTASLHAKRKETLESLLGVESK